MAQKKTTATDLRGMSDEQLGLTLTETEKHMFHLRFQSATDRLETPSEIRKAKKEIARILTIRRERELTALKALPADRLAADRTALEAKPDAPGKRKVRRDIQRIQAIEASKAPAKAQAAKGKGK